MKTVTLTLHLDDARYAACMRSRDWINTKYRSAFTEAEWLATCCYEGIERDGREQIDRERKNEK